MAKKLLTRKRQKWVNQFKPTVALKGEPLRYNAAVQARYVSDMGKLIDYVVKETEKEVEGIFKSDASKEFFAQDASIASIARINMNKLINKVMKITSEKSTIMAERMMSGTDKASKSSLHQSLKELSGGLSIKTNINSGIVKDAFKASVNVNVDLIRTIASDYLGQVKGAVNRSIQGGGGLESLIPDIKKFLSKEQLKVKNKAKNVALDQTRKAYNALNAARMQKIGLKDYEWVHSGGGQDPRELHVNQYPAGLNGGIFSLDDPPVINDNTGQRGIPGEEPNCKCFMRPVVKFNEGEAAA